VKAQLALRSVRCDDLEPELAVSISVEFRTSANLWAEHAIARRASH
jgi:hypothetical protein